jgi:hypothetical protein
VSEMRDVGSIVWREDLYPRFEPNPSVIQQYAEAVDELPPIEVNQHNELIDGYHRWTAHKKAKREAIAVVVTQTTSDADFLRLAIERNAKHGLQLSNADKKRLARQLYAARQYDKDALRALLSVGKSTLYGWLTDIDKAQREERNRQIADMWLACYTEEEIADAVGVSIGTINGAVQEPSDIPELEKLKIFSEYREPDWKPPLYDVWTAASASNKTRHFGMSEASFVDNLLYMYTEPFDIVVDPFAGGGSTIDVCKHRLRRYWASDRLPIVERRDIREWDILQGPPPLHKRWGDVSLMYLDPPYWRQAQGQYSDDPADLANMPLGEFYATLTGFITDSASKMRPGARIALIIQPTQWKAEDRSHPADHIIDLIVRLPELHYVRRIQAPYSTEQYNAQQVNWAKDNRELLMISREIIVWEIK